MRVEPISAWIPRPTPRYRLPLAVPSCGSNQFQLTPLSILTDGQMNLQYPHAGRTNFSTCTRCGNAGMSSSCSTLMRVEPISASRAQCADAAGRGLAVPSCGSNQFQQLVVAKHRNGDDLQYPHAG